MVSDDLVELAKKESIMTILHGMLLFFTLKIERLSFFFFFFFFSDDSQADDEASITEAEADTPICQKWFAVVPIRFTTNDSLDPWWESPYDSKDDSGLDDDNMEAQAHADAVARGQEEAATVMAQMRTSGGTDQKALEALAEELDKEEADAKEVNDYSSTSHDVSSASSHETKHSPERESNSSSTEDMVSPSTVDVPRFQNQVPQSQPDENSCSTTETATTSSGSDALDSDTIISLIEVLYFFILLVCFCFSHRVKINLCLEFSVLFIYVLCTLVNFVI